MAMRMIDVVLVFIMISLLPARTLSEPGDEERGKSLIGKWKLVSAKDRKEQVPQTDIDAAMIYVEFSKDAVTFYERGKKKEGLKYKIKADKMPHELQIIYDESRINYAIFSINKGMLTICSSNKLRPNLPEDRPDGFDVTSEKNAKLGGLYLEVFSLEK